MVLEWAQPLSFATGMSSFWDVLGFPPAKVPADLKTFASYVVPPVFLYIVAAVVAVKPQTRALRVALWPVVTLLAFRAAFCLELAPDDHVQRWRNVDLMISMLFICVHTLFWASAEKPFVRYLRPAGGSPSTIMDALDLATNLRGIGWEWSRGLNVPRETRPTNRIAFALYALLSGVTHGFFCGIFHIAIRMFTTGTDPSLQGSTIFDESLPFFLRCLRANIISILVAFEVYTILQLTYDQFTVLAVLLFGQDPAQWPPGFQYPWLATSLNEFWSRRWHQWFRGMFLLGAYPFTIVFGRVGTIFGAFLTSGLYHYLVIFTLDRQAEMWRMLVPFAMMVPGVLAERAFYQWTGRKVGGVVGWIWTFGWLLLWSNVMSDGFARAGMYVTSSPIDGQSPVRGWVEKSVLEFDAWLHSV